MHAVDALYLRLVHVLLDYVVVAVAQHVAACPRRRELTRCALAVIPSNVVLRCPWYLGTVWG